MPNSISKVTHAEITEELEHSVSRYHTLGVWIAAIFDPIFGITDYINIPHAWENVFVIRLLVSVVCFALLFYKSRKKIPSFILAYIPFVLISLQNAYTYSLLSSDNFLGHTLNYIALFIGASMFALWHWYFSALGMGISLVACCFFLYSNPTIDFKEGLVDGGLLLLCVMIFTFSLIQNRYSATLKTITAQLALAKANQALILRKEEIESQNKHITDSIRYAQRIQNAILPTQEKIKTIFPDSFILFKPKDIVSGDFYYLNLIGEKVVIAAIDCTGHGVPGAFMSMIGYEILNEIINVSHISEADKILEMLNTKIQKSLKQNESNNKDGMDLVLCVVDREYSYVDFAGAKNLIFYVQEGELYEVRGNKIGIGGNQRGLIQHFEKIRIPLVDTPTSFYLFSDGYQDQFGGENNQKFSKKRLKALIQSVQEFYMEEQKVIIERTLVEWKGTQEQIDDILVMGIRI